MWSLARVLLTQRQSQNYAEEGDPGGCWMPQTDGAQVPFRFVCCIFLHIIIATLGPSALNPNRPPLDSVAVGENVPRFCDTCSGPALRLASRAHVEQILLCPWSKDMSLNLFQSLPESTPLSTDLLPPQWHVSPHTLIDIDHTFCVLAGIEIRLSLLCAMRVWFRLNQKRKI